MNQSEKIRNAIQSMLISREELTKSRRRVENAELTLAKCEAEALRVMMSSGKKPVLFKSILYSVDFTPADRPNILQEKPMDFVDLTETG